MKCGPLHCGRTQNKRRNDPIRRRHPGAGRVLRSRKPPEEAARSWTRPCRQSYGRFVPQTGLRSASSMRSSCVAPMPRPYRRKVGNPGPVETWEEWCNITRQRRGHGPAARRKACGGLLHSPCRSASRSRPESPDFEFCQSCGFQYGKHAGNVHRHGFSA